jgi:hypothetical protein
MLDKRKKRWIPFFLKPYHELLTFDKPVSKSNISSVQSAFFGLSPSLQKSLGGLHYGIFGGQKPVIPQRRVPWERKYMKMKGWKKRHDKSGKAWAVRM